MSDTGSLEKLWWTDRLFRFYCIGDNKQADELHEVFIASQIPLQAAVYLNFCSIKPPLPAYDWLVLIT